MIDERPPSPRPKSGQIGCATHSFLEAGDFAVKITLASLGLTLALVAAGPAHAETVTKERFGCHAMEVTERLFQLVQAGDEGGFDQLLKASLQSGECKSWTKGTEVSLDTRTVGYACMKPAGSTDKCYWTPVSAIEADK
jgi:hypothetical protein